MTIEKGRPWGSAGPLAVDGVLAATDAEVRALVEQARQAGRPPAEVGLVGGDLPYAVSAGVEDGLAGLDVLGA